MLFENFEYPVRLFLRIQPIFHTSLSFTNTKLENARMYAMVVDGDRMVDYVIAY